MPFCKKQAERAHALSFLSSMPGEMPLCKNKPKEKFGCFMVPKRGVGWAWGGQKWSMKTGVGCFMAHKSGVGRAWEGSKWFPRVLWEWFGNAKNEAWKRGCVLHGSQEWGGKGLETLKKKHEKGFGCFMAPKSGVGRVWEGQKWSMKRGLGVSHGSQEQSIKMKHENGGGYFSWFPRVGWEEFGKAKNEAWKGVWVFLMVPKSERGFGKLKMKHEKGVGCFSWFPRVGWEESKASKRDSWFPRMGWEGLGKAQNEAWKRVWVLHGSQAWGGKGLETLKWSMKSGLGASWLPRVGWEGGLGVSHGSQEWGGKGLGKLAMKHEKGFWRFSWFPRVGWEKLGKAKNEAWKRVLGASWLPRVGWKGFGKVQNGSQECGGLMVPKSGVGRVWSIKKRFMVPKSGVGRAWEGAKWSMKKGLGASWFPSVGWEGSGKAKNEAWKQGCVLHGSQEWGGKGFVMQKMKHENGGGCFSWFPRVLWEWFGRPKMKHEKGFWRFSWFPRVGWERLGKSKNEAWKNKLKENILCHLCQVCLVKCRFAKTS